MCLWPQSYRELEGGNARILRSSQTSKPVVPEQLQQVKRPCLRCAPTPRAVHWSPPVCCASSQTSSTQRDIYVTHRILEQCMWHLRNDSQGCLLSSKHIWTPKNKHKMKLIHSFCLTCPTECLGRVREILRLEYSSGVELQACMGPWVQSQALTLTHTYHKQTKTLFYMLLQYWSFFFLA